MKSCCVETSGDANGKRTFGEEEGKKENSLSEAVPSSKKTRRMPAVAKPRVMSPLKDVTPAYMNLSGFGSGQLLTAEQALWLCLCCGKHDCGYETGAAIFVEGGDNHEEDDPCRIPVLETGKYLSEQDYAEEGIVVRNCTIGLLQSQKFFSNHKYIGTSSLDKKFREWLAQRLPEQTIDKNWQALRQTAKETLKFKRQECVVFIRDAFVGEPARMPSVSLWCLGLTNHLLRHRNTIHQRHLLETGALSGAGSSGPSGPVDS